MGGDNESMTRNRITPLKTNSIDLKNYTLSPVSRNMYHHLIPQGPEPTRSDWILFKLQSVYEILNTDFFAFEALLKSYVRGPLIGTELL